jgi:flavin-dependent dehydrogenase
VTRDLLNILDVPSSLLANAIFRMRLTAPDGSRAVMPSSDLVLDRIGFDRHLAAMAQEAGARLLLGHRFLGFGAPGSLRVAAGGEEIQLATGILVGADGPVSAVARSSGMYGTRSFYAGLQLRVRGSFPRDLYDVHLVVPQFFGWVVPESETVARVGVAARAAPRAELAGLLGRLGSPVTALDRQWGLIPIYDRSLPVSGRCNGVEVRLVGDAATMVKATTGGGLVPGLLGARALHASLTTGSSYARLLQPVRRRLGAHLHIRRVLNAFSDADYGRLVGMCAGDRVREVLASGSRDRPLRLLGDLLRADPRFAAFAGVTLGRLWQARNRSRSLSAQRGSSVPATS